MAGEVKIPGIGEVKSEYVTGALALIAGIVGYAWWHSRSANSSAAAAAPAIVDPNNPGTGNMGASSYQGASDNPAVVVPPAPGSITTNAQWVQAAVEYMANIGYDAPTVATALGDYLARQPLSSQQQEIVRTALGAEGPPPVGGPYAIITGLPTPTHNAPGAVSALAVTGTTSSSISLAWNAASGADSYRIDEHSALGHSTQTTTATHYTKTGLHYDLEHTFTVTGHNANGDGPSATVSGKTQPQAGQAPPPPPPPAHHTRTYTVRSGDTLWDIAQRYYGNANRWHDIYNRNSGVINSVAARHGKPGGGHWIFPGTTLTIP